MWLILNTICTSDSRLFFIKLKIKPPDFHGGLDNALLVIVDLVDSTAQSWKKDEYFTRNTCVFQVNHRDLYFALLSRTIAIE
jgi:hypothetical protein